MKIEKLSKGISILEVIIGASIILVLTTAIAGAWNSYISITKISNEKSRTALLIEQNAEILQFLRDKGWATNIASLSLNTPYYLTWYNDTFVSTTTEIISNSYSSTVVFSSVNRDAQDNISSSGVVDPKTRKVSISVYKHDGGTRLLDQAESLIHDVYNN